MTETSSGEHVGIAIEGDNKRHFQMSIVWPVVGIAWGTMAYSYAGSIIGTTLGQPSFFEYMGLDTNPHASALIGTMTGLFYAGGVFGCILNAWMADKFGRKWTAIFASVIVTIATAYLAGSVNIGMFIAFRFFVGVGAYMLYLTAPLWVVELVPPKGRSVLAGIVGLFGVIGYIMAAYVGVGFFYYGGSASAQWRAPLAVGCFPPVLFVCIAAWLPESPRWLLAQDKGDQAWHLVRDLHTTPDDVNHDYATAEFYQMNKQHQLESSLVSTWWEIAKRPSYRKRALIAFGLPVILYSTGNLVITTYAASIVAGMGYSPGQSLNLLAGTYLAAIASNLISLTYVDRVPRNIILSVGVIACTCVLSIETALVASFLGTTNKAGLSAAAAFLFLFFFTFNLFIEGPSYYYASEIFPTHLRAKGMTINVIGFCVINILWLEIAPTAFKTISWKYYLVFISLSVFGAATIFFTFPDTLNRPLEEVARLFGDEDLVAVYQRDIHVDGEKNPVLESQVEHATETSETHNSAPVSA